MADQGSGVSFPLPTLSIRDPQLRSGYFGVRPVGLQHLTCIPGWKCLLNVSLTLGQRPFGDGIPVFYLLSQQCCCENSLGKFEKCFGGEAVPQGPGSVGIAVKIGSKCCQARYNRAPALNQSPAVCFNKQKTSLGGLSQ